MQLNPTYPSTSNNIGSLYARVARFDQAFRWYDQVSAVQPDSAVPLGRWAKMYFNLGDYRTAEQLFERQHTLRPPLNWQEIVERAGFYLAVGRFDRVRSEIADLPGSRDGDSTMYFAMAGFVALYAGEYEGARAYLERLPRAAARVGSGGEFLPLTGLSYAYWKLGNVSGAQRLLALARTQDQADLSADLELVRPQDRRAAAYDLARIDAIQGNHGEALRWLRTALAPGHYPSMYTHLGPRDPMLENLRGNAEFEGLMAAERERLDLQRQRVAGTRMAPSQQDLQEMIAQGKWDVVDLRKQWREWAGAVRRPLAHR
jgi:tetratricopeptide (TPR) repeat protein